jgi:hypothetical protein|tara:strand:- start:437 stop:667 length:231 start_codon:yes stop_codon:yes gene_type:complete
MDKRTKKEIIGVGIIGTAVALGVAYANRKKIKRNYDIKKYDALRWKDNKTQGALLKAEKLVKNLQDKTTSVRDIAW